MTCKGCLFARWQRDKAGRRRFDFGWCRWEPVVVPQSWGKALSYPPIDGDDGAGCRVFMPAAKPKNCTVAESAAWDDAARRVAGD
jgi:hypothetical protein